MDGAGPYLDGDVYDVTIGGPYMDKRYSVSFFDLYKSDTLDAYVEGTPIADGQTLAKSAASPSSRPGFCG